MSDEIKDFSGFGNFENVDPCGCPHCKVADEQERQLTLWGEQNHPNGTGHSHFRTAADQFKHLNSHDTQYGSTNWANILLEEIYEALAESDPAEVKKELIQSAAVIFSWIDCIERGKQ